MKDDDIWFWVFVAVVVIAALTSTTPSECVPSRYDSC